MRRMPRTFVLAALVGVLVACGSRSPAPAPAPDTSALATQVVAPLGGAGAGTWDGTVQATDAAVLMAQTNARVLTLPSDVGARVARGDVLVRLTDVEQRSALRAAQAQAAAARAAYADAEANYRRFAAIAPQGYVSRADFERVRMQRDAAKAQLDAAGEQAREAGAQQDYTVVRAPFDGVVTKRYVQVGEAVAGPPFPQQLIAIAALAQLRVEATLPQAVAEPLRQGGRAEVLADGGRQRVAVTRVTVFPVADPATHTVNVRFELPAGVAGLYPGMTVKLALGSGASAAPAVLAVPRSALVQRGELAGVYVVTAHAASLRQLRIGETQGERVTVLAGLAAGERVATDPAAAARWLVAQRAEHAR